MVHITQAPHRMLAGAEAGKDVERRVVAVVGLVGIALIHVLDVQEKLEEARFVGVLFIVLIGASLALAEALLRREDVRLWAATTLLAGGTMVGYALSRSVGLPGEHGGEKGNWAEPLGLASLLVESVVAWLAVTRLAKVRTTVLR